LERGEKWQSTFPLPHVAYKTFRIGKKKEKNQKNYCKHVWAFSKRYEEVIQVSCFNPSSRRQLREPANKNVFSITFSHETPVHAKYRYSLNVIFSTVKKGKMSRFLNFGAQN
jgi:hypothetical protein